MADRYLRDPRPDLAGGDAYRRLLAYAWLLDGPDPGGLFAALHGLRCLGTTAEADPERGARLRRGEVPAEEYAALRARYLVPHAGELRRLLAEMESSCRGRPRPRPAPGRRPAA